VILAYPPAMTSEHSLRRRLAAGLLAGSLALAVAPMPVAASHDFTMDLGRRTDFVAQTNFVQCVGASMQMMLNMVEPGQDRSAATQRRLQRLARAWSGPRPDGFERKGAGIEGWVIGLNIEGAGPYRIAGSTTLQGALKLAATAIRETGRPVGLLMWHGRHAWVMSGFRATADPADTDAFRVTRVIVEDPLYPYGSKRWGSSPRPGESITPARLGKQFVPRRSSSPWAAVQPWAARFAGQYVLVLPYEVDRSAWLARVR
jgi:hypothetical protein